MVHNPLHARASSSSLRAAAASPPSAQSGRVPPSVEEALSMTDNPLRSSRRAASANRTSAARAAVATATASPITAALLAPAWAPTISKSTGKTYYVHNVSGETRWKLPPAEGGAAAAAPLPAADPSAFVRDNPLRAQRRRSKSRPPRDLRTPTAY